MDLSEFVATALADIARGIGQAQATLKDGGAYVGVPYSAIGEGTERRFSSELQTDVTLVHFDVAVTSTSESGSKGGARIAVVSMLGAGGELSQATAQQSASRVQFTVSIVPKPPSDLPGDTTLTRDRDEDGW